MPWDAVRHLDANIHRPSDQLRYVLALLFFAAALALDFTPLARSLPSLAFIAAVALIASPFLFVHLSAADGPAYSVTDLGTLGGYSSTAKAVEITAAP